MTAFAYSESRAFNAPGDTRYRLVFHGRGGEYFGIWVVNLLLSVVTIGIYSAWAKVRTARYFHGATELDGARFGYHGKPLAILIGRLIGLALFIPYIVLNKTNPILSLVFLALGLCVLPWLVMRAMRFRLKVTSYRNLRFSFSSEPGVLTQAYIRYLLLPILAIPTLGLIQPYGHHQRLIWLVDNSRYGQSAFRAEPAVGKFYLTYLAFIGATLGIVMVVGIAIGVTLAKSGIDFHRHAGLSAQLLPLIPVVFVLYLCIIALAQTFQVWLHKLVYDRISLGAVRIKANYTRLGLMGLYLVNLLLLLFTLGFSYPWVRCRTARYMLDGIELFAPNGLDQFIAGNTADESAIGDQIASVFDVDVGIGL